jgi:drug/metabolite transporter (DMT)-like permease
MSLWSGLSDNGRASLSMIGAMAFFALEDAFLKTLTLYMPIWQLLAMTGLAAMAVFWLRLAMRGHAFWTRALLHPMALLRNLGEIIGAFGFVTALALGMLASTSAILQVLPLTLVLGAALFLGEKVEWRRWLSVAIGFAGVLLILRPGTASFHPSMLWAVIGVVGLTLRDLATRLIPKGVPSDQLSASAYGAMVPAGLVMAALGGDPAIMPDQAQWTMLLGTLVFGVLGYTALVTASRIGEASVVAPFRYSRLAFALVVAFVIFGVQPDLPMLAGAALIAGAGGYAMWREAGLRCRSRPASGTIRPGDGSLI